MILGGLALAFSRLIDNSVVVLENIFRHMEMGEPPEVAAEKGGQRGGAAGAGRDAHHGDRVLPGDLSVRRQPVPVHRAGAGGGAVAVRVVLRGDDGGAAVLREVHQGRIRSARRRGAGHAPPARAVWSAASTTGSTDASTRLLDGYDRLLGVALLRARGHGARRSPALFVAQPRACIRCVGVVLLPAHRSRAVRHQPQGAHRHAPRGDRPGWSARSRTSSARMVAPDDLGMIVSNIGVHARTSRRSTPATPGSTPPSCR